MGIWSARAGRATAAVFAVAALAAAPSAPAAQSDDMLRRAAERDARQSLTGARAGDVRLPLVGRADAGSRVAAGLAGQERGGSLLVGLKSHGDLDALTSVVEGLGSDVRPLGSIGVISFTADSVADAVEQLRADERVAYVERNRRSRPLADPFTDQVDPETGIPFDWAFERVRAPQALAAVGGRSERMIAIVDTGGDVGHPDLAANIAAGRDVVEGTKDVTDTVGHGTFVAGTIGMVHDNDIGGRGVGGATPLLIVKTDDFTGQFAVDDIVTAIEYSIRRGARIINMSLGGDSLSQSESRALDLAFFEDVLPVAAAGNEAQDGNPIGYPAAAVGGEEGTPGTGLAVGATKPDDTPADFSSHGFYVSVAAPGEGQSGLCPHGVLSTIPRNPTDDWDHPESCSKVFGGQFEPRWSYGPGTSFAAPIASGISALTWQAEPRLQSQQVGEVVMRSARQSLGEPGTWNEYTGRGIVDGEASTALARVYDVVTPGGMKVKQSRKGRTKVLVTASGAVDRTDEGDELAGDVTHFILRSINGGDADVVATGNASKVSRTFTLGKGRRYQFIGAACDANGNCAIKRLSSVRRK